MVSAAFSNEEARNSWGDSDDPEPSEDQDDDGDSEVSELDFRVSGQELFSTKEQGTTYRYDGRYYDIVTGSGSCTQLTWTEQGVYLDGYNRAEAPANHARHDMSQIRQAFGIATHF